MVFKKVDVQKVKSYRQNSKIRSKIESEDCVEVLHRTNFTDKISQKHFSSVHFLNSQESYEVLKNNDIQILSKI